MEPLKTHNGIAAVLNRINVDTDQIIPKQFLKRIERTGYGRFAFFDWRYLDNGDPNPDFELNRPEYKGASILRLILILFSKLFPRLIRKADRQHAVFETVLVKDIGKRRRDNDFKSVVV